MNKRLKVILVSGAIFLAGCSIAAAISPEAKSGAGFLEGNTAADFALSDLDGNTVSLSSYIGKKAVLLDFAATWCSYCVKIIPRIKDLHKQYGGDDLEIILVYTNESPDKVRNFISSKGASDLQVLTDASGLTARKYGISGFPTVVLIDKDGLIRFRGNRLPEDDLKDLFEKK